MQLKSLIAGLKMEKMKGEGLLNGSLPLQIFGDGAFAVNKGALESIEPGYLSYQWDMALASEEPNLNLTGKALENFTYEKAVLNIQKERGLEPVLVLDIKGKNPKLLNGREFDIKVNVSGKILATIESAIGIMNGELGINK